MGDLFYEFFLICFCHGNDIFFSCKFVCPNFLDGDFGQTFWSVFSVVHIKGKPPLKITVFTGGVRSKSNLKTKS